MAKPRPPGLDYVLRTKDGRTEYKGTHVQGLELLFVALPDALARRKMIDALEKKHAKMLAQEGGPDLDQQTASQVAALGQQVHPDMAMPSRRPEGHAARLVIQPAPARECTVCAGSGYVSTGVDEAPTTLCAVCDGTGLHP